MELPPQVGPRWFSPSREASTLVVISPLEWWYSHWDQAASRTRRCAGAGCLACSEGSPVQIRFVLLVADVRGQRHLLELRERHRAQLQAMAKSPFDGVGTVLKVWRSEIGRGSPVEIEVVDRESVVPVVISSLVQKLGLPAVRHDLSGEVPSAS